ncbi:MAG: helix-turn-helix transcriptional regulator [Gammaproteobacteria bacterium]|nr:helix-turn-helix transcriptional regulator [Gammaproteobacteria bacterium]
MAVARIRESLEGPKMAAAEAGSGTDNSLPRFMSVRQVARYLNINEKKVYSLVNDGKIPASKLTGKWLFPRDLVDQWILESSHGGLLTDRLIIAGSDDPLLARAIMQVSNQVQARGLIGCTVTSTQLGLSLLARRRADVCALHWGPAEESLMRHPALLKQYAQHQEWVLVRLFLRDQGLLVTPGMWTIEPDIPGLFSSQVRWVMRQEGAGSNRFLQEITTRHGLNPAARRVTCQALSEHDAASMIAMGHADVATGVRATAAEFGLDFVPIGKEAFDLAMPRGIFFRTLFQKLLEQLRSGECQRLAQMFGGYDFSDLGKLVWSA